MMIQISVLNDLGNVVEFVTLTDIPLDGKPEEHPVVRSAFRLLALQMKERGFTDGRSR